MNAEKFPLRVLFWEATLKCNAYCKFCGSRCGDAVSDSELTKEEICRVFRQIADRYDASQIMINVTGGEPLMRKDLCEIMTYASSLGFSWGMVTNGVLLNEKTIEKLKAAHLKTISVSLDGLAAVHERLRRLPGCFLRIADQIKQIKAAGFLETIMVTTVVSKENLEELPGLKEFLKDFPVDVWRVCPVDSIGRAENNGDLLLSGEETETVMEFIRACREEKLPYQVQTSCSHYLGKYEFQVRSYPFVCMTGKTVGSILADGDIFVCPNVLRKPELIQGNVRTDNFADVWEKGFAFFRDDENRRTGKCRECVYFKDCRGDSMHTRDFDKNEPGFCMKDYGFSYGAASGREQEPFIRETSFKKVISSYKERYSDLKGLKVSAQSRSRDCVIFSPEAVKEMSDIFRWGEDCAENMNEQLGFLKGHIYRNEETEEESFLAVVEHVEELEPEYTSPQRMIPGKAAEDRAKMIITEAGQNCSSGAAQDAGAKELLGYIHSHPGDQGIAMSLGDYKWHRRLYRENFRQALNVIVNPQKKMLAAYAGPAANHVEVHLLTGEIK